MTLTKEECKILKEKTNAKYTEEKKVFMRWKNMKETPENKEERDKLYAKSQELEKELEQMPSYLDLCRSKLQKWLF